MSDLYTKDNEVWCKEYTELYIPKEYFEEGVAENAGATIETFGVVYFRTFVNDKPGKLKRLDIPATISVVNSTYSDTTIKLTGIGEIPVMAVKFMPDSPMFHQTLEQGRLVAEKFLHMMMNGKLPKTLGYDELINLWWTNLAISGVSFQVPSKIYEMIISTVYRDSHNTKLRFGQWIGKQVTPNWYAYQTGSIREIVKNLSTFSGMVFEDMGNMISSGIANTIDDVEEPISPLEKLIHY